MQLKPKFVPATPNKTLPSHAPSSPPLTGTAVFRYDIIDRSTGLTNFAFAHVIIPPVAPSALPDVFYCPYNTLCKPPVSILANDTALGGGRLVMSGVPQLPATGALQWRPDGMIEYQPDLNFWGNVHFTYKVTDVTAGTSATTTVTLIVQKPTVPLAVNNTYYLPDGSSPYSPSDGQRVQVNDYSPSGSPMQLLYIDPPPASAGNLTYSPDGSFVFTPAPGYHGAPGLPRGAACMVALPHRACKLLARAAACDAVASYPMDAHNNACLTATGNVELSYVVQDPVTKENRTAYITIVSSDCTVHSLLL